MNRLNPAAYRKIEEQVLKDANKFTKKFPVKVGEDDLPPEAAAELKKVLRRKFYKGDDGKRQLLYERVMTARGLSAPFDKTMSASQVAKVTAEARRTNVPEEYQRVYKVRGKQMDEYIEETGSGPKRQEQFSQVRSELPRFPMATGGMSQVASYINKNHPEKSDLLIQILQGPSFQAVTKETAKQETAARLASGISNPLFQVTVKAAKPSKGSKEKIASKFNNLVEVLGRTEAEKIRKLAPGFIPSMRI